MALVVQACKKLLRHYQVECSERVDKNRKMEGDYHGQRQTAWFLRKEGVKPSDVQRRLSAVCGEEAHARSTVFNWVRNFNSGKATAQAALH
jgi:hypothetical protein